MVIAAVESNGRHDTRLSAPTGSHFFLFGVARVSSQVSSGCDGERECRGNMEISWVGEVTEWPIVQHWKCCVGETPPRVRIPPSPRFFASHSCLSRTQDTCNAARLEVSCVAVAR